MITFCATEEWICQFGCARAPFVQRRLTAEASSQLHALGDRAHEEMVGTRVPSARGDILVGDGFGMSWSPCYASCNTCVACFAVKFLLKRQSATLWPVPRVKIDDYKYNLSWEAQRRTGRAGKCL